MVDYYVHIDEAHKVRTNMEAYGGSFAKALAQAILHADKKTTARNSNMGGLVATFLI